MIKLAKTQLEEALLRHKVALIGAAFALTAVLLVPFAQPVRAAGCSNNDCTEYTQTGTQDAKCGGTGSSCKCGGNLQAACNSTL